MPGNRKVFISRAPQDSALCLPLFAALDAWEVDYATDLAHDERGQQLSDTIQQAIVDRDVFIRVCTPATQQSMSVTLQTSAFRGLLAADRQRGRGDRRVLINLILAPGYVREPFDNATLFIDATSRPQAEWLGDLGRALGLSRLRGRLSRRSLLGLGAAAVTTFAATAAAGAFLLDYRAQSQRITSQPGSIRWHVPASKTVLPSPAFGDNVVYAVSETGVYALALGNGGTIWHNRIATPQHDYLSPVVADNLVIMGYDATLYALNTSDGKLRWSETLKSKEGAWLTGASLPQNGTIYTLSIEGYLTAWAIADGSRRWSVQTTNNSLQDIVSGPTSDGSTVYVGSIDHNLYAFNAHDGSVKWTYTTRGQIASTPAVANGTVYVGSQDSYIYAVNASDGSLRWKFHAGRDVNSPVTVAGGVVFVGSDDYYLYALDGATGGLYWSAAAGDVDSFGIVQDGKWVRSQAAVEGGIVAVTAQDTVYAFNVRDGSRRWRWKPQLSDSFQALSDCALSNGFVCVGARDQNLYLIGA